MVRTKTWNLQNFTVEGNTDLTFNVGQWIQTSVPVLQAHSPLLLTVTPVSRLSEGKRGGVRLVLTYSGKAVCGFCYELSSPWSLILHFPSTELWNDELQSRKNKKKDPFSPDKKKKPVVVSDILQTALELNRVLFITCLSQTVLLMMHLFTFLSTSTSIYHLHAAGPGHPGGLDRHQEGQ